MVVGSEQLWDAARRSVVAEHGGAWRDDATSAMQGMSSPEWSRYLHDRLGVPLRDQEIVRLVVTGLLACCERELPLLPGAVEAARRVASHWPLALATSSNRVVIDEVLELSGLAGTFDVTVSSEEVAHGKPFPDVYLAAARGLGAAPEDCAAVEALEGISGVDGHLDDGHLDDGYLDEGHLDEEEAESFPASEPHSEWAGPSN